MASYMHGYDSDDSDQYQSDHWYYDDSDHWDDDILFINDCEDDFDLLPKRYKRETYLEDLFSDLKKVQSENTLCDINIRIGSDEFHTHKNILAASSDYFKTMFTSGFQEAGSSVVQIEGDSDTFRLLLEFIYTGKMDGLTKENVVDVLDMVCYLHLSPHALGECMSFIGLKLRKASLSLQAAYEVSLRPEPEVADLVQLLNKYMGRHFTDLAKEHQFIEQATKECLENCLENVNKSLEEMDLFQLFEIVIMWLKHEWDDRKQYTCDLLKMLPLRNAPSDTLKACMDKAAEEVPECREMLKEACSEAKEYMYAKVNPTEIKYAELAELSLYLRIVCGDQDIDGEFSFKQDYEDTIMTALREFQTENMWCDITIKVGSREFQAHKNILAATSDYFKKVFNEADTAEVSVEGSSLIFELLLKLIYSEEIDDLVLGNITGIMQMASFLQLKHMLKMCRDFVDNKFDEKVLSLQKAYEYSLSTDPILADLVKMANQYMGENLVTLASDADFLEETTAECLLTCLDNSQSTPKQKEVEILKIVIKWVKHCLDERKVHANELLQKLRLGLIPVKVLRDLHADMKEIPECGILLEEVIQLLQLSEGTETSLAIPPLYIRHPQWFAPRKMRAILIQVGGINMVRNPNKHLDAENKWYKVTLVTQLPGRIRDHSTAVVNGHLCIAGGMVRRQGTKLPSRHPRFKKGWNIYPGRFCWYDMNKHQWLPLAPMIKQRKHFALVHIGGFVYALGGTDEQGQTLLDAERYNITNNKWETIRTLTLPSEDPSAVVYKGKILVYGLSYSVYSLQIYTPGNEREDSLGSWHVALNDQHHAPRSTDTPRYVLTVQNDRVYRIVYEDITDNTRYGATKTEKKICVSQIVCDFESDTPNVSVGSPEDQSQLQDFLIRRFPSCNNIFCIEGELYANVLGCIYKMGVKEAEIEETNPENWKNWENLSLEDNGGCVVLFTYDRETNVSRKTFVEDNLPDWM